MNKKLKIVLYIILALIIIVAGFGIWYVNDYYHADDSVKSGTSAVLCKNSNNYLTKFGLEAK